MIFPCYNLFWPNFPLSRKSNLRVVFFEDVRLDFAVRNDSHRSVFVNFKKLEAVCFDEEYALLRGVNVGRQNRLLLALTAVTVVLMLRLVGMAMIVALLTLPAAIANRFTKRLGSMIACAIAVCFVGSWLGIWLSVQLNSSTGPTIILVVALFYALSLPFKRG